MQCLHQTLPLFLTPFPAGIHKTQSTGFVYIMGVGIRKMTIFGVKEKTCPNVMFETLSYLTLKY